MNKTLASILASLALFLPISNFNKAEACTGARQMAIGDAGVAACNDSHAVYWDQAELPNLKQPEVCYTKQFGDTDNARYDDVFCATYPLNERVGMGIQLMNGSKGNLKQDGWNEKESWAKIGAGYTLNKSTNSWSYSIGGAITEKNIKLANLDENNQKSQREKSGLEYEASFLAEKKDVLKKGDDLRLGILARNQFGIDGDETGRNLAVRPAAAYSVPNRLGDFTLASEFYEADELAGLDKMLGQKGAGRQYAKPRIGIEQEIGTEDKNIALRAGWDGAGDEGKGTFTAGFGVKYKNLGLNVAYTDNNVGWLEVGIKF
jgi:hypothetical protein